MAKKVSKPPTKLGAGKKFTRPEFALGTRPSSLAGKTPQAKASNTRDYGTKTPPAMAIQPGNPIGPPSSGAPGPTAPGISGFDGGGSVSRSDGWKIDDPSGMYANDKLHGRG